MGPPDKWGWPTAFAHARMSFREASAAATEHSDQLGCSVGAVWGGLLAQVVVEGTV